MALELKKFLVQGLTTFNQLKHVHCRLLRLSLDQDNYLINIILRYSFHFGNTHYTNLIFNHTHHPNIYLYNTMIRGMVSNHSFHHAIQLYTSMRKDGFTPDDFTFPFVLKACARLDHFELGLNLHCLVVKTGFDCDVFAKTSLVCLYSKCGYLRDARKVFDDIPEKNVVSWTAIICGKLGDLKNGEWLDRYISESGLHRNVFLATSLVDMYAKCGSMEDARRVFDVMPEKDIVCWSAMIQGYASNGLPKEALDLFFEMQKENVRPDCYAIVGVLSACARLGALDLGNWAQGLMDTNEFLYNPVMGTALIDLYAKCGSMGQAFEIFKMMKGKDRVVFNAVISGLAMNGHVRATFGVFGQMGKYVMAVDILIA
ncbi:unnamed protein product [Lupinus luteus]|uniref:Pentatricopeptide repeat-containing protein n=1 Tax=Lupinus luteus TaxID=3873 RepID=A0AAV1W2J2_LUPLU